MGVSSTGHISKGIWVSQEIAHVVGFLFSRAETLHVKCFAITKNMEIEDQDFKAKVEKAKQAIPILKSVFGKIVEVIIVAVIGYFIVQWIIGNNLTSIPLGQLTITDLTRYAFAICVGIFFVGVIKKILAD